MDYFFVTLAVIFAAIGLSLSLLLVEGHNYRWLPAVAIATLALTFVSMNAGWHI